MLQVNAQNLPSYALSVHELRNSIFISSVLKRQKKQRLNWQHLLHHGESKGVLEKHLLLFDYVKAFDCVQHNKSWKILKIMVVPGHLTCPLSNLYAGQEVIVRTGHTTQIGSKLGKEYFKAVYCHPAYSTYMQSKSHELMG